MGVDWSLIGEALGRGKMNIPRFDYEVDEAFMEERKINGFVVFQEAGKFYVRSICDWSTEWHDDRCIRYVAGGTIEEAIEAWLRDPEV